MATVNIYEIQSSKMQLVETGFADVAAAIAYLEARGCIIVVNEADPNYADSADVITSQGTHYAIEPTVFDRWNDRAAAATEPTPAGLQYVMPGCDKDRSRGPIQMDLF